MSPGENIAFLVRKHEKGVYTERELFPLFVKLMPEDSPGELLGAVPANLVERFRNWVADYPLEGGILIRESEPLPMSKIIALKKHVAECSPGLKQSIAR